MLASGRVIKGRLALNNTMKCDLMFWLPAERLSFFRDRSLYRDGKRLLVSSMFLKTGNTGHRLRNTVSDLKIASKTEPAIHQRIVCVASNLVFCVDEAPRDNNIAARALTVHADYV